jgi:hypothetical protein
MTSRAQIAIEFLMIVGAVVFFASLFLLAIQGNQQIKINQHQNIQLKEIALTVQNEINLALESSDGYSRQFEIPELAGMREYEIVIDAGIVYIKTTDDNYALTLPIPEITGDINKTQNKIEKINGQIFLNQ